MIAESVTSLVVTTVATGLIFAKFSRSAARVVFSKNAVIEPVNGVPTLSLRVGNERGNLILEATIRLTLTRTEKTSEGVVFYKLYDLRLVRDGPANATIVDRDAPHRRRQRPVRRNAPIDRP